MRTQAPGDNRGDDGKELGAQQPVAFSDIVHQAKHNMGGSGCFFGRHVGPDGFPQRFVWEVQFIEKDPMEHSVSLTSLVKAVLAMRVDILVLGIHIPRDAIQSFRPGQ